MTDEIADASQKNHLLHDDDSKNLPKMTKIAGGER